MSTVAVPTNGTAIANRSESVITYIPLGEQEPIHLTLDRVKRFLCVPTRSGKMPSDEQVMKYMMLCKAQSLNPWVNDAYLTGYDSKDGPSFSLITSHQAILKRAEASSQYDGMESGVIVLRNDELTERQGDLVLKGEVLVGGWARVHRKDRSIPSYDALNLSTFDKNQSRWNSDKAGMIVKCAEASALRKAFPSTLAAMYCKEEMDRDREVVQPVETRPKADRLLERIVQSGASVSTREPEKPVQQEQSQEYEQHVNTEHDAKQQLLAAIPEAKSESELDDIMDHLRDRIEDGELTPVDYEQVNAEVSKKRAALKAV